MKIKNVSQYKKKLDAKGDYKNKVAQAAFKKGQAKVVKAMAKTINRQSKSDLIKAKNEIRRKGMQTVIASEGIAAGSNASSELINKINSKQTGTSTWNSIMGGNPNGESGSNGSNQDNSTSELRGNEGKYLYV